VKPVSEGIETLHTLVLIPTEMERRHLTNRPDFDFKGPCELCGFGPITAAARTSAMISQHKPARVVLTGIAGTFDPDELPVGTATIFDRVTMYGIGVGNDTAFLQAEDIGFSQWTGSGRDDGTISGELNLETPLPSAGGRLLTCCASSRSRDEARQRLDRFPDAIAEDMEGFGVGLACQLAGVPVAIVRGISNEVGDRQNHLWQIPEAMAAAWLAVSELVYRDRWNVMT